MTIVTKKVLVSIASVATAGVVGTVGYVLGKRDGLRLAAKQSAELNAQSTEQPRNTHRAQPQA